MQKLTNEKARELLKELQYAKVQMGGQLSIRDEYFKQALEKQPQWITCNEQMPEAYKEVLVYCTSPSEILVAHRNEFGDFIYMTNEDGDTMMCLPTHWMPLPEGPL